MTALVEAMARVLEPQAWAALGIGDSLAYKNRRTSSLRKARLCLRAMAEVEPSESMIRAGRDGYDKALHVPMAGPIEHTFRAMLRQAVAEAENGRET